MSRDHRPVAALFFLFLLIGITVRNREILLAAIPFLLYLASGLIFAPGEPSLEARRSIDRSRVVHGEPVTVTLRVLNRGASIEELSVEDLLPPELPPAEGSRRSFGSLPQGGETELTYTVRPDRGRYRLGGVRIVVRDHLGLFSRSITLPLYDELAVLPPLGSVMSFPISPKRTLLFSGPISTRTAGQGTEFMDVREYRPGDPLRRVNWRVTSRSPSTVYTNEYEQERVAEVGVILDARKIAYPDLQGGRLFEQAVQATAAVSDALLTEGNRVSLLTYGGGMGRVYPGYGKIQREKILHQLASVTAAGSGLFEQLEYLPVRLFPPKTQIILVSPLLPDDEKVIIAIRARGYSIMVISPDPVLFECGALGCAKEEPAVRILLAERVFLLRALRRSGIFVLDWNTENPIETAVAASAGAIRLWMRRHGGP